jgi:hypothetical protein
MEKRMGRPPIPPAEQLSEIVQFRLAPAERKACEDAAERVGLKFSAWIRRSVLRAAKGQSKRD